MAGDLLETYLLWLIEAHAQAPEAGRMRIRPGPRRIPTHGGTVCQESMVSWPR
jgi:hypothetical protein